MEVSPTTALPAVPVALAIAGPTASGKSALALAVASRWPVEIISVDSAQVYRGMDIGTAKPSAAERQAVPHHLIDILEPSQSYSAARFVADAHRLIGEIRARGRAPLLVGGSMLYFKALMQGLDSLPPADAAIRAELDAQAAQRGWPALHAQLAQVDALSAARLAPNDSQRIQRALEVWQLTGQPMSALQGRGGQTPLALPMIAMEPMDRAWLHGRIAARFDAMLAAGLTDEVRTLKGRGDLHAGLPSMRCVGYRQAWEALEGNDLRRLRERGMAATRQLAKRQLTWLRSMQRIGIAADAPDALDLGLAVAAQIFPLDLGMSRSADPS